MDSVRIVLKGDYDSPGNPYSARLSGAVPLPVAGLQGMLSVAPAPDAGWASEPVLRHTLRLSPETSRLACKNSPLKYFRLVRWAIAALRRLMPTATSALARSPRSQSRPYIFRFTSASSRDAVVRRLLSVC